MPTIMVVEDDLQNRQLIKTVLEFEGYSVTTIGDVTAALELLEVELPDVICCDLMMPGMNGFDFFALRKKIQRLKNVPVVAITGIYLEKDEIIKLGAHACLYKPFAMSQLISTVESALNSNGHL